MLAVRWGHTDVVSTLIERGADVKIKDKKGQTALFWSTKSKNRDTVLKLIVRAK
jgi:ankyrin repeat protein